MKKTICTIAFFIVLLLAIPIHASQMPEEVELTLNSTTVLIDGAVYQLDVAPLVIDGVTLLPIRFVAEHILGANVMWDEVKKEIRIVREDQRITLWLGRNIAIVNEEELLLTRAPLIRNNRTLVPLRFLSERMGLDVHFNAASKKISISLPIQGDNTPPVALFTILNEEVRAGQALKVSNTSFDPDGHAITGRLWEIVPESGQRIQVENLDRYFPTRRPGKYLIRLKVKDQLGAWSKWYEQHLEVYPNQPPAITSLQASKTVVAQGEPLSFTYQVVDEPWDQIVEERWVYRWRDNAGILRQVVEKPRALFGVRSYEVALTVRDSFNNWSNAAVVQIQVTQQQVQSELRFKFSDPKPGEMIVNTENYNLLPDAARDIQNGGPALIVSNSPETVPSHGIMYQDQIQGPTRVFYHHKNGTGQNSFIKVWLDNKGDQPVEVTINKASMRGPSVDEMQMGHNVAYNYLSSNETTKIRIAPGQAMILNSQQARRVINPGQLMAGMLDIETSGPLQVTVAMVGVHSPQTTPLKILPTDGRHPRGTFATGNIEIQVRPHGTHPEKLLIGTGRNEDFLLGIDALTGKTAINRGNYGVVYIITVHSETTTGLLLNPRGTVFKGAVKSFDGQVYSMPKRGIFSFCGMSCILGVAPIGSSSFTYTPPGGSDTPLVIGLIPESHW